MFAEALLLAAFQVGPFYEEKPDYAALRPLWSVEGESTDVLWPVFTSHKDWWRFCFFMHYQTYGERGYQFEVMPLWWNGESDGETYWGLFPLCGYHPHFLLMYDLKFGLWPIWTQYEMPRLNQQTGEQERLKTKSFLWPFFHWRSDGAWGFWPLYVENHQRESDHRTALWPIVTWASYREDRDTAGAGSSWMVWPIWASVDRERERQLMFIPPLFSHVDTSSGWRGRYPWPLIEFERFTNRDRTSFWPLYEHIDWKGYGKGEKRGNVTRFGWKLVELYDSETRVFPFWVSRPDDTYFRLWPFWESEMDADHPEICRSRLFPLLPIRWIPAVDRNWSKFWTFYETEANPVCTYHSLFWGIIRWRTVKD